MAIRHRRLIREKEKCKDQTHEFGRIQALILMQNSKGFGEVQYSHTEYYKIKEALFLSKVISVLFP